MAQNWQRSIRVNKGRWYISRDPTIILLSCPAIWDNRTITVTLYCKRVKQFIFSFYCNSHLDKKMLKKLMMVGYTDEKIGRLFLEEKEHDFMRRIHTRDFYGGRTIMRNITDHVNQTRRMIMLLSK